MIDAPCNRQMTFATSVREWPFTNTPVFAPVHPCSSQYCGFGDAYGNHIQSSIVPSLAFHWSVMTSGVPYLVPLWPGLTLTLLIEWPLCVLYHDHMLVCGTCPPETFISIPMPFPCRWKPLFNQADRSQEQSEFTYDFSMTNASGLGFVRVRRIPFLHISGGVRLYASGLLLSYPRNLYSDFTRYVSRKKTFPSWQYVLLFTSLKRRVGHRLDG